MGHTVKSSENKGITECDICLNIANTIIILLLLLTAVMMVLNPSAWSDEPCSSCCTLSLIRLYLDKLGSKCNQAASRLFVKELALL